MADIAQLLSMPGTFNASRIADQNQQSELAWRKAQTDELIQKARQAQEMAPLSMEFERAKTRNYNALTEKYLREPADTNSLNKAKADALAKLETARRTAGLFTSILAADPKLRERMIDDRFNSLPDYIQERLRPSEGYKNYSDKNINSIVRDLHSTDPEYLKVVNNDGRTYASMYGADQRLRGVENTNETNLAIAKLKKEADAMLAKYKSQNKNLTTDQLFAKMTSDLVARGEATQAEADARILAYKAVANLSTPNTGITVQKDQGGDINIENKPPKAVPTVPSGSKNREALKKALSEGK